MPHRYRPAPGDHDPSHWLRHAMSNVRLATRVLGTPGLSAATKLEMIELLRRSADDVLEALDAMDRAAARVAPDAVDKRR